MRRIRLISASILALLFSASALAQTQPADEPGWAKGLSLIHI